MELNEDPRLVGIPRKPSNINLDSAPSPMELSWLQQLNLLLTRITSTFYQTSDWRKTVVDEAKHTLLCLADRREISGGRRVVTSEHLTRALYYFDVRMLLADVDDIHTGTPRHDFFRDFYNDGTSHDASEEPQLPSNKQSGAGSVTSPKPKTDTQNAASPVTATIAGIKRKASDGLPSFMLPRGSNRVRENESRENRSSDRRSAGRGATYGRP
ncbi:hypothetical protein FGADI_6073 [Fusarium gaditjirri]|uniref:Uncharacterized protein n=1 Tax=Fusarium gaditjirri TaxID=282569 RepID=A0A8H4T8Y2_9HYPO|nr:hypothetical protein FGADI_6073 [Fusarium gaditjirri]